MLQLSAPLETQIALFRQLLLVGRFAFLHLGLWWWSDLDKPARLTIVPDCDYYLSHQMKINK